MKRTIAVCLACLTAAALLLSGCGKVDDKLTPPPIVGNERTFDEEAFSDRAQIPPAAHHSRERIRNEWSG